MRLSIKSLSEKIHVSCDRLTACFSELGLRKHRHDSINSAEQRMLLSTLQNRAFPSIETSCVAHSVLQLDSARNGRRSVRVELRRTVRRSWGPSHGASADGSTDGVVEQRVRALDSPAARSTPRRLVESPPSVVSFPSHSEQSALSSDAPTEPTSFAAADGRLPRRGDVGSVGASSRDSSARPPIVALMGHVDHGKTSLLDCMCATRVARSEPGGITQRTNVYCLRSDDHCVTFLDTPGHEAFSPLRRQGAELTDIVVLVVAADDGIMPQTVESIEYAQSKNLPIIVAISKIDRPHSDVRQIKTALMRHRVVSDEWGGDSQIVTVSTKPPSGIDSLIDAIRLQTELLQLSADTNQPAQGIVVDSYLDPRVGPVSVVLVRKGVFSPGQAVSCGLECGRVKSMRNASDRRIDRAGPSCPVKIVGLSGVPGVGEEMRVVHDLRSARETVRIRRNRHREQRLRRRAASMPTRLPAEHSVEDRPKILSVVVKCGSTGSVESIRRALHRLSVDRCTVRVVSCGVGPINQNDAVLAKAARALLIGFNVPKCTVFVKNVVRRERVTVRRYTLIYELLQSMQKLLRRRFPPQTTDQASGALTVRCVFRLPRIGSIAGGIVTQGSIRRGQTVRVRRGRSIVCRGKVQSLKRFAKDVSVVVPQTECGISIECYQDIRPGDVVESVEHLPLQPSSSSTPSADS